MKKIIALFVLLLVSITSYNPAYTWGFFAHQKINRLAIFTLPPEMIGFYKRNINFITEHAVDPDKRRYASEGEAPRHYIDIDHYSEEHPFEVMPRKWDDAVAKYTEDTLQAYGIVPWHIEVMVNRLTYAFKSGDVDRILQVSADLGHYIGDSHVPLHTTENYNGQMTGQRGIHGFWESRLPELYFDSYDLLSGRAKYIENPLDYAWETVEASHAAHDSVLDFERILNEKFPQDRKYAYEQRGATTMKVYSEEYSKAFDEMIEGQVERRMLKAIYSVGSFWYTAWVNAGKPNLEQYYDKEISEEFKKQMAEEEKEFQNRGKIQGREHDH